MATADKLHAVQGSREQRCLGSVASSVQAAELEGMVCPSCALELPWGVRDSGNLLCFLSYSLERHLR